MVSRVVFISPARIGKAVVAVIGVAAIEKKFVDIAVPGLLWKGC